MVPTSLLVRSRTLRHLRSVNSEPKKQGTKFTLIFRTVHDGWKHLISGMRVPVGSRLETRFKRFLWALDKLKVSLISWTEQKERINSAATVTSDVTCVNAHFHANVIRRSMEAILTQPAASRKRDPPSGWRGLNWVTLRWPLLTPPRPRSRVKVWHTGVYLRGSYFDSPAHRSCQIRFTTASPAV